jgi:hypothetical protein
MEEQKSKLRNIHLLDTILTLTTATYTTHHEHTQVQPHTHHDCLNSSILHVPRTTTKSQSSTLSANIYITYTVF